MSKRLTAAIAAMSIWSGAALAQEVKVGVVLPYTGIGAEFAQQMDRGMELYLKLNADQVKPYMIKFIKRDSKAPSGADAKVAVQGRSLPEVPLVITLSPKTEITGAIRR